MPSHFDTLQLHAGQSVDPTTKARAVPIYANTSYVFENSEDGAQSFQLNTNSYVYSRIANPTNAVFEGRIAALEEGAAAVAVASGQAAQFVALSSLAGIGQNIVASAFLYGGTYNQLKISFKRLGVEVRFVGGDETVEDYEKLIDENTRAIYTESIGNPTHAVADIEALGKLGDKHGIPLVIDNTFGAGGALVAPIHHGAHIVVESATKWIGGHGTTIAGVVVDSGKFDWTAHKDKFPQFVDPTPSLGGQSYVGKFGNVAFAVYVRAELLRDLGPTLNPFGSFLLLQGLETLSLRVERHVSNALKLAQWLEKNEHVAWVSYLGLESHPHHERAKKYLKGGFGGVLTFGAKPKDGKEQSGNVVDNLKLASNLANVGDAKTLVISPYFTTHSQLNDEELKAAKVSKDMIRVSVGLEFIDDIIADFEQSFKTVYA